MSKNSLQDKIDIAEHFKDSYEYATLVSWARDNQIKGIGYYDKGSCKKIADYYDYGVKMYNCSYFIEPKKFLAPMIKCLEESKYGKIIQKESGKKYVLGKVYRKLKELHYNLFEEQEFLARFENKES